MDFIFQFLIILKALGDLDILFLLLKFIMKTTNYSTEVVKLIKHLISPE